MKHTYIFISLFISFELLAFTTNGNKRQYDLSTNYKEAKSYTKGFKPTQKKLLDTSSSDLSLLRPMSIFGDYKREEMPDGVNREEMAQPDKTGKIHHGNKLDYNPIGKIVLEFSNGPSNCTGTMIGPKHILTAAHCVFNFDRQEWYKSGTFYSGITSKSDTTFKSASFVRASIPLEYEYKGGPKFDYAVVELSSEIGIDTGWLPFGYRDNLSDDEQTISITGYPVDMEANTIWNVICPSDFSEKMVMYRCDTYNGMGGAPIIAKSNKDNNTIYGLHIAGGTAWNSGVRITSEVFKVLLQWRDKPFIK